MGREEGGKQKHDSRPKTIQKDFEIQRGSLSSRLKLLIHFREEKKRRTLIRIT